MKLFLQLMVFPIVWILFGFGHIIAAIGVLVSDDSSMSSTWVSIWYPIYNWAMNWSCYLQDLSGGSKYFPWDDYIE
jgi:hypothetical protein